jgi:hypothetical protein
VGNVTLRRGVIGSLDLYQWFFAFGRVEIA